jgi:hypothetical protein
MFQDKICFSHNLSLKDNGKKLIWSYTGKKDDKHPEGKYLLSWGKLDKSKINPNHTHLSILCGKINGIMVLDFDKEKGMDLFKKFEHTFNTYIEDSTNGFKHVFIKYDNDINELLTTINPINFKDTSMDILSDGRFCITSKSNNAKSINEISKEFKNYLISLCEEPKEMLEEHSLKYYNLLSLLDDKYFKNYELWVEPAYALYNENSINNLVAFTTWVKLLELKAGNNYNYEEAKNIWYNVIPKTNDNKIKHNEAIITMAKFKKIIGGSNTMNYNSWKNEYEPIIKKEKTKSNSDLKQEENEVYETICDSIIDCINSFGKSMIYDDNKVSFSDVCKLHKHNINIEDIALLFNQTYINIFQRGSLFLVIKEINDYRCPKTKEYKFNTIFNKIEFAKEFSNKIMVNILYENTPHTIRLSQLIFDISSKVNVYDNISFYPYGSNSIDTTPKNIFNIFTGFLHKYEPEFVYDESIVNTFLKMYKEILCNGVEKSCNFEINKLAHILQYPEIKTGAVSIFKAGQGVGKSFLLMFLMNYVFGKHLSITIYNHEQLISRFNSHLMGKLFCILEEGVDLGNTKDISMFKGLVRCPTINIEYKGINVSDCMDCCMNFFIATNNDYNRLLGESDERTANFNICSEKYKRDTKYFSDKNKILYNFEAGKHIFHYLINKDISKFDIYTVPETDEKLNKKINASPSIIRYLYKLYKNEIHDNLEFEVNNKNDDKINLDIISDIGDKDVEYSTMQIYKAYKICCEADFSCKPASKEDVIKKYISVYFEKNEYKTGRFKYTFNKTALKNALNKWFNTEEFK